MNFKKVFNLLLIFLEFLLFQVPDSKANSNKTEEINCFAENGKKISINILLLLPLNETYKFSLNKTLASLSLAIHDIRKTDFGSKFEIDITSDTCDCTGIKAPVNAMENIYSIRKHTKKFQAVFGPMCD